MSAAEYTYNGDNLLVERTLDGETIRCYYDSSYIIAEGQVVGGAAQHVTSYIRGNELIYQMDANWR